MYGCLEIYLNTHLTHPLTTNIHKTYLGLPFTIPLYSLKNSLITLFNLQPSTYILYISINSLTVLS